MKSLLRATLLAAASAFALSSGALAACQPGQYEVVTDASTTPPTTACFSRFNYGLGTATTGQINPSGPLVQWWSGIGAEVHGTNGTAVGDHAKVGAWVPAVPESDDYAPAYDETLDDGTIVHHDQVGTAGIPAHAAPVDDGTAIGANSSVQHDHSTALGAGAASTADHQVTLGTGEDTVRAPGITSQLSKDRQSGPLEFVTTDADGNLASDGGALSQWASATDGRLATHDMLLKSYGDKLKDHAKGIAIAAAMPDAWLSDSKNFGVFASFGGFDGETALGVAAIGRLGRSFSINAKIGTDTGFEHVGYQVGAGWQF